MTFVPDDDELGDTRISRRRAVAPGVPAAPQPAADAVPALPDDLDDTVVSPRRVQAGRDAAADVAAADPDDRTVHVDRGAPLAEPDPAAEPEDDDSTVRVPRRRTAEPLHDHTLTVRRRSTADDAPPADELDDTLVSARAARAADRSIPHAVIPPRERAAADGAPTRAIYRPRAAEPVRVERTPPPPQAPQAYVDTAAQQHVARSSRTRTALLVGIAVVAVAAVGVGVLIALLSAG
ncbi:hypothetical protein [Microbacterium sp. KR10-403]|uniref:hypothetical protein n=1 Tax=Microbacterium sp. KR10-403 TaxID=3158581 RepID=UPI0032E472BC